MTGKPEKTQPQKLLEEIIPKDLPRDENEKYPSEPGIPSNPDADIYTMGEKEFPSITAQQKYWEDKEKATEPKPPRKWSLARRRAFEKMKRRIAMGLPNTPSGMTWVPVPPMPPEEPVAMIKFCPHCGKGLEKFLA